ncbi:MAG: DoxX family protein, partial [Gemmatimonadales bacterium]
MSRRNGNHAFRGRIRIPSACDRARKRRDQLRIERDSTCIEALRALVGIHRACACIVVGVARDVIGCVRDPIGCARVRTVAESLAVPSTTFFGWSDEFSDSPRLQTPTWRSSMSAALATAPSPRGRVAGRILSGLAILFLTFDVAIKLVGAKEAVQGTVQLGYQPHHVP